MRRFVTVLAVTLAALTAPVHARELTQHIPVTNADYQTPEAAAALYARITATAKALCAKLNRPTYGLPQASPQAVATCEREAVERAVGNPSMPFLASIHAETLAAQQLETASTKIATR